MTSTGLLGEDFVLVDALPRKGGSAAGNSGELIPKKCHDMPWNFCVSQKNIWTMHSMDMMNPNDIPCFFLCIMYSGYHLYHWISHDIHDIPWYQVYCVLCIINVVPLTFIFLFYNHPTSWIVIYLNKGYRIMESIRRSIRKPWWRVGTTGASFLTLLGLCVYYIYMYMYICILYI